MAEPALKICAGCGVQVAESRASWVCVSCGARNRFTSADLRERPPTETSRELARRRHLTVVPELHYRPQTRAECVGGMRPCPFVGCRHHLALEVTGTGSIKFNFDPEDETRESCSLDVADRGALSVDQAGEALGVSHARIEQIEQGAFNRLRRVHAALLEELNDAP